MTDDAQIYVQVLIADLFENHRSVIQICIISRLWNQLPDSFRQPHQSCLDSLPHSLVSSSLSSSPLSSSITPSLLAQNLPFQQKILPTLVLLRPWTAFTITGPDRTYYACRFILVCFFFNYFSVCSVMD